MTTPRIRAASNSPFEVSIGFSRAVRQGQIVAVSGTAPVGPNGTTVGIGDAAAQTRRCLEIIREALETVGASLDTVIRTRIFLVRVEDWRAIGKVHGEFFATIRPASTMVQVAGLLDSNWLVEIEADAFLPGTDED